MLIEPSQTNGLKAPSQVMVDKIIAMPREKCGAVIGHIDEGALIALNHRLAVVIGLADRPKGDGDLHAGRHCNCICKRV